MQKPKKKKMNECCKCGHRWKQRGKKSPKKCPRCNNPNWNKPSTEDFIRSILVN